MISILRVTGIIFILSPILLYWLIHGSYDRYLWIINGPFPFSHLGSAPFQILVYMGLVAVGISLIVTSFILQKRQNSSS